MRVELVVTTVVEPPEPLERLAVEQAGRDSLDCGGGRRCEHLAEDALGHEEVDTVGLELERAP